MIRQTGRSGQEAAASYAGDAIVGRPHARGFAAWNGSSMTASRGTGYDVGNGARPSGERGAAVPRKKKSLDESLILRVPKNATLKQIYAIARKNFTAADLQRYTELDDNPAITTESLLREMEAINEKAKRRRKTKR